MTNSKKTNLNSDTSVEDTLLLKSDIVATIFHNQVTEVQLKRTIEIPAGYIGVVIPVKELQIKSSVLIEGGGYILPSSRTTSLLMRKGTSGSVKIRIGEPIAHLVIQKIEKLADFSDNIKEVGV